MVRLLDKKLYAWFKIRDQANYIASLPDNWDEEGAEKVDLKLIEHAVRVANELGFHEHCIMTPCGDGSVDLHWRNWKGKGRVYGFELLLNLSEEGISYYAEYGSGCNYKLGPFKYRKSDGSSIKVDGMPLYSRFAPKDGTTQQIPCLWSYMRKWWPYSLKERFIGWAKSGFNGKWYWK